MGTHVKLRAYGGGIISRRVVRVEGDVIVVCKDEEFDAARRENRKPIVVGFRREYVVEESPQC